MLLAKRGFLSFVVLGLLLILIGCGSKEEKQAEAGKQTQPERIWVSRESLQGLFAVPAEVGLPECRRAPGAAIAEILVGEGLWVSKAPKEPPSLTPQPAKPNPTFTNYQAEILTSYNSFYTTLDEVLLVLLPTLAEDRLFKDAPNLQGIDLKNITKQDLDHLNLTPEQAGKVFEEILKLGGRVVTALYGSTKAAIEATARAYDADTGKTVGAAIIDALTEEKLTQVAQTLMEVYLAGCLKEGASNGA